MLRIDGAGLAGRDAEEARVEAIDLVQVGAGERLASVSVAGQSDQPAALRGHRR